MSKVYLKMCVRLIFLPHYLVIGCYNRKAIGCTYGRRGCKEVLEEEPGCTFKRVSRRKCPICKGEL